MRRATPDDIASLLTLMAAFYAEAGYQLDRVLAGGAFATLLADERLGYIWLIDADGAVAGYVVVTLQFGMEYAGMIGCIDDLYVVPALRNRGLSSAALGAIRDFCRSQGVRALTVVVDPDNGPAQTCYGRIGLTVAPNRQMLAMSLASPAHVV